MQNLEVTFEPLFEVSGDNLVKRTIQNDMTFVADSWSRIEWKISGSMGDSTIMIYICMSLAISCNAVDTLNGLL